MCILLREIKGTLSSHYYLWHSLRAGQIGPTRPKPAGPQAKKESERGEPGSVVFRVCWFSLGWVWVVGSGFGNFHRRKTEIGRCIFLFNFSDIYTQQKQILLFINAFINNQSLFL